MSARLFILLVHFIIAISASAIIFFCTNKYTLLTLFIIASLVFLQLYLFDGCVMGKLEGVIPVLNVAPNQIIRAAMGMSDTDITLETIEKFLVGATVYVALSKLLLVLLIENMYGSTVFVRVPDTLKRLTPFEKTLLSYF